jgi:hypothetical protein
MKEENKPELGTGRVAFLARLPAIKEAIESGRTVMSVYREYGKQLGIGYTQIDRYVNRFIKNKPTDKPAKNESKGKEKERSTLDNLKSTLNQEDII